MRVKKTVLIILDGWGHGNKTKSDAIHHAKTPFVDSLYSKYPNCELLTNGENVGLPKEQMGNSEVGHLNIGSGRVVSQNLVKINKACEDGSIADIKNLKRSFTYARDNNKALHLMGLVSDGGIHSHQNHLYKLCELAQNEEINDVFVHVFTDGRDCNPKSGKGFIKKLEQNLFGAKIASICGRYYAMDRDMRWKKIKLAYDMLVHAKGEVSKDLQKSIQSSYNNGITDEFLEPIIKVDVNGEPIAKIRDGDAVICFNYRRDRCREITSVLTQQNMTQYGMNTLKLHYTTMTNYDNKFKNVYFIYDQENLENTLGEVISDNHLSQIRIAETEKYPHVTFFFSGGREEKFEGEKRIMIDSPKITTYDLQPEMSAPEVTLNIISELEKNETDFICLNIANPDMVGHTGDYNAIIKAIETVDNSARQIIEVGLKNNYAFIVISDHGNADFTINSDGTPNTEHSKNPVPCFAIGTGFNTIENGILADVAPTILHIMGIKIPEEMTGNILVN